MIKLRKGQRVWHPNFGFGTVECGTVNRNGEAKFRPDDKAELVERSAYSATVLERDTAELAKRCEGIGGPDLRAFVVNKARAPYSAREIKDMLAEAARLG